MTREETDRLVNEHFLHEANDDLQGVLGTFIEEGEHEVIGGPYGPLRGKAALASFYQQLFRDVRCEDRVPVTRLYGEGFVVDESIWSGIVADGRMFSLKGISGFARIRLLHTFWLQGGLIARAHLWFDARDLLRQLI